MQLFVFSHVDMWTGHQQQGTERSPPLRVSPCFPLGLSVSSRPHPWNHQSVFCPCAETSSRMSHEWSGWSCSLLGLTSFWQPTQVLLLRKSHGWRSLMQASVHGVAKSQTTKRLHFLFHFPSLSRTHLGFLHVIACSFPLLTSAPLYGRTIALRLKDIQIVCTYEWLSIKPL